MTNIQAKKEDPEKYTQKKETTCKDACCTDESDKKATKCDDDVSNRSSDCSESQTAKCNEGKASSLKMAIICCQICWQTGKCCGKGCCRMVCCVIEMRTGSQQQRYTQLPKSDSPEEEKKKASYAVSGITCADCSAMVENRLKRKPGIFSIQVSAVTGRTDVVYDPSLIDDETIAHEIKALGHDAQLLAPSNCIRVVLDIEDAASLTANDVESIESRLRERIGVMTVTTDIKAKKISIEYEPSNVGVRTLKEDVESMGFSVSLSSDASVTPELSAKKEVRKLRRRFWVSVVLGVPVLLIAFVLPHIPYVVDTFGIPDMGDFDVSSVGDVLDDEVVSGLEIAVLINWILATPIQFWVGLPLYLSAYKALRYGRTANMDALVMLSTTTAYVYSVISTIIAMSYSDYEGSSFFETSAVLLMLIMLGRYLEATAKGKTSNVLSKLIKLQAPTAILLRKTEGEADEEEEEEEEIDVMLVQRGDLLKVLPGSKIPTDGLVAFGTTTVDESMVTGESMPVSKQPGDAVYGSTVNQQGTIHIRVTRLVSESTLATISRLVEQAQTSRPPIQRIADRIAAFFVPAILLLSLCVFILWVSLAASEAIDVDEFPISFALQFALAVLVISCPCAIGLAVPTAVMVGTGMAAKHGILFKSGASLEACRNVKVLVFDKTGTLTYGKPSVVTLQMFTSGINTISEADEKSVAVIEKSDKERKKKKKQTTKTTKKQRQKKKTKKTKKEKAMTREAEQTDHCSSNCGEKNELRECVRVIEESEEKKENETTQEKEHICCGDCEQKESELAESVKETRDERKEEKENTVSQEEERDCCGDCEKKSQEKDDDCCGDCEREREPPVPSTDRHATGEEFVLEKLGDEERILYLIGSAERGSEHPLGKAILEYAHEHCPSDHPLTEPENFQAVPGKGLVCTVSDKVITVGNRVWMHEHNVQIPDNAEEDAVQMEEKGQTVVWAAADGTLIALVALADAPKPEAAAVIHELHRLGIDVWLLSGDNSRTVATVASQLGIVQAMGGLLPENKVEKIRQLQKAGGKKRIVAMVGDGINDSPALAQANVGIAVGAGTDIALEASDVILVKNDLRDVLIALDLAKTTVRRIRINFAWAFLYNVLGIPLAAGILYPFTEFVFPPALAGLSELLSSLPVVVFSLLLRCYRPPRRIRRM